MDLFRRSIPGTIASTEGAPPVSLPVTIDSKDGDMAGSGFMSFARNILLPLFISGVLYLLIFQALLPLYRRHRARYSQYLPLQSTNLSSHLPPALQPSSLRDRLSTMFFRLFLPSTWAFRNRFGRRNSLISADGELFDVESGEAMVGFDVQDRSRRRDGMERQISNMQAATRAVSGGGNAAPDSNRRLSRDLEEGFQDDSEDEDEAHEVVAGRRDLAARR